jgi:DNA polymerase III epsilon subunit-like protein
MEEADTMAYFLFDTETTGLRADYHEICSLSAIMLDNNLNFKAQGHMKLMPEHWDRAEAQALSVNGIDPKTWTASHESNVVSIQKMIEFIDKNKRRKNENIYPMGHNVDFDIGFLKALMSKNGFKWESIFHHRKKDTIQMMDDWRLFTDEDHSDYRLASCCSVFGIEISNSHDATADAFATMQLAHAITADIRNRIKGIKGML